MQIITSLILMACIIFLVKQGKKLMNQEAKKRSVSEQGWLEELRNIQSIRIKVVPANEIYRYILGSYFIFIAFCFGAAAIFCFETSVIGMFTGTIGTFGLNDIIGIGIMLSLFYSIFTLPVYWRYAFFKKAIAPNLKHGDFILAKLVRIGRAFLITNFSLIFIASAFPIPSKTENELFGVIVISAFVAFLLTSFGFSVFVSWEIERLGLPHFFEGIKELVKNNKREES